MTTSPPPDSLTVPGQYALQLVELSARFGVEAEEILGDLGFSKLTLAEPSTRVPWRAYRTIVLRAKELTGEEGLGFAMGLQMRLSWHGFLGFAAMTAGTIGEALEIAERFVATRTQALAFSTEVDGDRAYLVIHERVPLGELREFVISALMVGLAQIGAAITGRQIDGSADVTFDEPPAFARFRHLVPGGEVRFGQPVNRLVFAREVLELPLMMADPVAAKLAKEQCERELDALGESTSIVGRVRGAVSREGGGYRTLEEVADVLHVSARTLKRQLAARGTTFSDLLDEVRRERALELLAKQPEPTIEELAAELGYSDSANFSKAFKRWTGKTPAAFRKR